MSRRLSWCKGPSQIPSHCFFVARSPKSFKTFWVYGHFSSGYLPATNGRQIRIVWSIIWRKRCPQPQWNVNKYLPQSINKITQLFKTPCKDCKNIFYYIPVTIYFRILQQWDFRYNKFGNRCIRVPRNVLYKPKQAKPFKSYIFYLAYLFIWCKQFLSSVKPSRSTLYILLL